MKTELSLPMEATGAYFLSTSRGLTQQEPQRMTKLNCRQHLTEQLASGFIGTVLNDVKYRALYD